MSEPISFVSDRLQGLASAAGNAWAAAYARALQSERRAIVGAWPGTLTEARARVLAVLSHDGVAVASLEDLRSLARTANHAARDAWRAIAVLDEEET